MNPGKFGGFLLVNLLFCIWIGWLLDSWMHTSPTFLIIMILYALGGSFYLLLKKRRNES